MARILIRAHKDPFRVAGPEETIREDLIGNNTGNLVFSQAVHRLLSVKGTKIRTSPLRAADRLQAGRDRRGRIDHLVLPLANAFRPGYAGRLDRLSDLMEQAGVPVTVLGVGAQATLSGRQARKDVTGKAVQRFVRTALRHGNGPIGVRGDFTRRYLADLGFGDDDVRVIGCPSMFMYGPELKINKGSTELDHGAPIAFNVSPYLPAIGPISRALAERYPRLVYMAQNQNTLELLLTGRYPAKPTSPTLTSGGPVSLDHPLIRQDRVRFFLDPITWIDHLTGYDFSFGTRIHGNITALLAGTPALVLAHDSRTLELADYHHIPHRTLSDTDTADTVDPAELYATADYQPLNAGHAERWETFRGFLADHGLRTIYDDGEDRGAGFDNALASVHFPPPVHTPLRSTPEELYAMRRELTELRMRVAELESGRIQNSRVARNPDSIFHRSAAEQVAATASPESVRLTVRRIADRTLRGSRKRVRRLARRVTQR